MDVFGEREIVEQFSVEFWDWGFCVVGDMGEGFEEVGLGLRGGIV